MQTICSWIIENGNLGQSVPSIRRIQEVLVTLNDKEQPFIGSREWIGSFEVSLFFELILVFSSIIKLLLLLLYNKLLLYI